LYYYEFNIEKYRADTAHLSLLEHGIYRQLIDTYYQSELPLCADDAILMRSHCVRTSEEKEAFNNVINDFFELKDGFYHHVGCDKQLEVIYSKSEKARNSARIKWEKHRAKLKEEKEKEQKECERNANASESNANASKIDANQYRSSSQLHCESLYSALNSRICFLNSLLSMSPFCSSFSNCSTALSNHSINHLFKLWPSVPGLSYW